VEHEPLRRLEDVEQPGPDSAREDYNREEFQEDLRGAVDAAGAGEVADAVAQVARGDAKPEALMWWIDELRDADRHDQPDDIADRQEGIVPDFIPDTQRAGGAQDVHDPHATDARDDATAASETATASEEDADYFFSAVRKRAQDADEPEGNPDDDGGGDAKDAKAKPKSKKAAR